MTYFKNKPYVLIISGPTAAGKTVLSLNLARQFSGEIINADVGQFYSAFSVGTAKPLWKRDEVAHHLFDIIDEPKNLSVHEYKKLVLQKVEDVWGRGKLPIIVGGSLFYLKSLFFSPLDFSNCSEKTYEDNELTEDVEKGNLTPWERLNEIDMRRAESLHPNDLYRINRALQIWEKTNIKPSDCKPKFDLSFHSCFLFLNPPLEDLVKNINQRTEGMMSAGGWIDEVEVIVGTEWESFLKKKKFIGYSEILDWLRKKQENKIQDLQKIIQIKTKQYAQRQKVFWKSFRKELVANCSSCFLCRFAELKKYCDDEHIKIVTECLRSDLEKYREQLT